MPATFIVPLLAVLYGCQPEEPKQQPRATAPAATVAQQPATNNAAAASAVSKEEFTILAKDIGCFACHSIEKKLLGPAWKQVAVLYRSNPEAEAKLTDKIIKGGDGVWGNIAMPAYPDLDKEKIRILVKYILSL
ncbi:MAG: c-type cytochrome [Sulfuricella sp.]